MCFRTCSFPHMCFSLLHLDFILPLMGKEPNMVISLTLNLYIKVKHLKKCQNDWPIKG